MISKIIFSIKGERFRSNSFTQSVDKISTAMPAADFGSGNVAHCHPTRREVGLWLPPRHR
jgi:hypothetical protein